MDETIAEPSAEKMNLERWGYLALGTLAMLLMGVIYAWSVVKVPLAATFGWTASQLALNYSMVFCFFCIGGIVSSYLSEKLGVRTTILLGGLLICVGYLAVSRITTPNILLLYLLYGAPIGAGTGMAYTVMLAWIGAWFPDKKGTCSGILMMGFGFSGLVLGKILAWLFNVPSVGWRSAYALLGIVTLLVLAVCALCFCHSAPAVEAPQVKRERTTAVAEKTEYSTSEMLQRPSFWMFYVFCILAGSASGMVFSITYDFCISLGGAASIATTAVGLLSACNGMSRIATGMLYDHAGHKRTLFISSGMTVVSVLTLLISVLLHSLPLGIVGLCLTGFTYGSSPVISATVIRTFYGSEHFASNYGVNNTRAFIGSFTSVLATGLLSATGTYAAPFAVGLVLALIAFTMHHRIREA
ncbi:MAG: MFS transporter [Pseudoflavonifractor sp.]